MAATDRAQAVITGASSGIGAAFAARLAGDGYDLTLVARRRARLAELAARLAEAGPGTVDMHVADLADPGGLRSAEDLVAAMPRLDLLVNNAGFAGYGPFASLDPAVAVALIGVHVTAPTRLTRAALPAMVERGRGAVINIASLLAFSGSLPPDPCRTGTGRNRGPGPGVLPRPGRHRVLPRHRHRPQPPARHPDGPERGGHRLPRRTRPRRNGLHPRPRRPRRPRALPPRCTPAHTDRPARAGQPCRIRA